MSCPTVTSIQKTECIGNSLPTINSNFNALKDGVCDNNDQILAAQTLLETIRRSFVGIVSYFPTATAPEGWLILNGQEVSRTTYSDLWTFAQNSGNLVTSDTLWSLNRRYGSFSSGITSGMFRLPDLRGHFLRGSGATDGASSGVLGQQQTQDWKTWTWQSDYTPNSYQGIGYTHAPVTIPKDGNLSSPPLFGGKWELAANALRARWDTTSEVRPVNVALLPCIKY